MSTSGRRDWLSALPSFGGDAAACPPDRRSSQWVLPEIEAPIVETLGASAGALESRRAFEESYRAGYADGARDGARRAEDELRTAGAALRQATDAVHAMETELLRRAQGDLTALALAVAQKIIGREVAADAGIVGGLVQHALALLPTDRAVEVRLHPEDLRAVESAVGPEDGVSVRWVADDVIERGSFVVESPQRLIDGRTDVALRTLYERFDSV